MNSLDKSSLNESPGCVIILVADQVHKTKSKWTGNGLIVINDLNKRLMELKLVDEFMDRKRVLASSSFKSFECARNCLVYMSRFWVLIVFVRGKKRTKNNETFLNI